MPALVNISVGSSCGTTGELRTNKCPLDSKNLIKDSRTCAEVIFSAISLPLDLSGGKVSKKKTGKLSGPFWLMEKLG
jgi:hypothetical protein